MHTGQHGAMQCWVSVAGKGRLGLAFCENVAPQKPGPVLTVGDPGLPGAVCGGSGRLGAGRGAGLGGWHAAVGSELPKQECSGPCPHWLNGPATKLHGDQPHIVLGVSALYKEKMGKVTHF